MTPPPNTLSLAPPPPTAERGAVGAARTGAATSALPVEAVDSFWRRHFAILREYGYPRSLPTAPVGMEVSGEGDVITVKRSEEANAE